MYVIKPEGTPTVKQTDSIWKTVKNERPKVLGLICEALRFPFFTMTGQVQFFKHLLLFFFFIEKET